MYVDSYNQEGHYVMLLKRFTTNKKYDFLLD